MSEDYKDYLDDSGKVYRLKSDPIQAFSKAVESELVGFHDWNGMELDEHEKWLIAQALASIQASAADMLLSVSELISPEACEPDCDDVRHARHQGSWEQHMEDRALLDNLAAELRGTDVTE